MPPDPETRFLYQQCFFVVSPAELGMLSSWVCPDHNRWSCMESSQKILSLGWGGLKNRWKDHLKRAMKACTIPPEELKSFAADRTKWKLRLSEGISHFQKERKQRGNKSSLSPGDFPLLLCMQVKDWIPLPSKKSPSKSIKEERKGDANDGTHCHHWQRWMAPTRYFIENTTKTNAETETF